MARKRTEPTLLDATIIEAPLGRPRAGGGSTRDPEASHTYKHRRTCLGYKAPLATDRRGLLTDYRDGKASEHDLTYFEELTAREKTAVDGDSADRSAERERQLERRGVKARIIHQRVKGQTPLAPADRERNRRLSRIRAIVEHPIAWIKNMGHRRTRYRGRWRNVFDFGLIAAAYNLKRSFSLMRRAPTTPEAARRKVLKRPQRRWQQKKLE